MTQEDLICVPAMIMFGFTDAPDQPATLARLFCEINFSSSPEKALVETSSMNRLANREYEALLLTPLAKSPENPDTILLYGNPAQVMRLVQAYSYVAGERVPGHFGGKVECDEYLIAPFKTGKPRVAIPGMGDRIFSMTQDDEMVFALPGQSPGGPYPGTERVRQQNRGPLPGHLLPELPAGISQVSSGLGEGTGVVLTKKATKVNYLRWHRRPACALSIRA